MPVHKPDLFYDVDEIVSLAGIVGANLRLNAKQFHGIVALANGGLVPALLMSRFSGLPILDVMRLRRYEDDQKEGKLTMPRVLVHPKRENVAGKHLVLGDDVLDEAYSYVRGKHLLEALDAHVVRGAFLDFKLGPRKEGHFTSLKPEDFFVGRVHEGRPWIQYSPWEAEGTTHEGALDEFVNKGHIDRQEVDRVLDMLKEPREAPLVA